MGGAAVLYWGRVTRGSGQFTWQSSRAVGTHFAEEAERARTRAVSTRDPGLENLTHQRQVLEAHCRMNSRDYLRNTHTRRPAGRGGGGSLCTWYSSCAPVTCSRASQRAIGAEGAEGAAAGAGPASYLQKRKEKP